MPVIQRFLTRLGYVKLDRFGLVLTPERRILTLRPVVLDDGLGNKIVGWEDHDLPAMELQSWEPFRPAPQRAVATRVTIPSAPVPPTRVVAPTQQLDDDDWEWTIALARARVAAEEAEAAAAALLAAAPPPPPVKIDYATPRPLPRVTAVTVVTRAVPPPIPAAAMRPRITTVTAAVPAPSPEPARSRAKTPITVIPIPKLPSLPDARLEPVVRALRMAKGTGPVNEPPRVVSPGSSRSAR